MTAKIGAGKINLHAPNRRFRHWLWLLLIGCADLGDVFVRIFIEILFAAFAAQFHFLIILSEHKRLAHVAVELLAGDRTGCE